MKKYFFIFLLLAWGQASVLLPRNLGLSDEWNFTAQRTQLKQDQSQTGMFNFDWYMQDYPTANTPMLPYGGIGLSAGQAKGFVYALPIMSGWLWRVTPAEPLLYLKTGVEARAYSWWDRNQSLHLHQAGYGVIGLVHYWDGHIDFLRDPDEKTLLKFFCDYLFNPTDKNDYQIRFGMGVYYQIQ